MSWKFAEMRWRQDAGLYESSSERWSGLKNQIPEEVIYLDGERVPLDHDWVAAIGPVGSIETGDDVFQHYSATGRGIRNRSAGRPPSMSPPALPHQQYLPASHSSVIPLLHLEDHSCHVRAYSKSTSSSITRSRTCSDAGALLQSYSTLSQSSAKSPRDFTLDEHRDPEMANMVRITYRKLKARVRRRRASAGESVVDPVIDPVVNSAAEPTADPTTEPIAEPTTEPTAEPLGPEPVACDEEDTVTATQGNLLIDRVMSLGDAQRFATIVVVHARQPVLAPLETADNSPLVRNFGFVDLASLVQNSPQVGSIIEDDGKSLTLLTELSVSALNIGQERPVSPLDLLPGEGLPTSRLGGMGLAWLETWRNVSELDEVGKMADYGFGREILRPGTSYRRRRAGNHLTTLSAGIKTPLVGTPPLKPRASSAGATYSACTSIPLGESFVSLPIMTSADSQIPVPTEQQTALFDYESGELTPDAHPSNPFLTPEEVNDSQNDVEDSRLGLLHPTNNSEMDVQSVNPFISTQDDEEDAMLGSTAPDDRSSNPFISEEDFEEEEEEGQDDGARNGKEGTKHDEVEAKPGKEETEEVDCKDFAPDNQVDCLTETKAVLRHKTCEMIDEITQASPSVLPIASPQSVHPLHKEVRLSKFGVFNPVDISIIDGHSIDLDTSMRRGRYGYNSESASLTHLMDRGVYVHEGAGKRYMDCETTHFSSQTPYPRKGISNRFSRRTSKRTDIPDFIVGRYDDKRQDPFLVDPTSEKGKGRADAARKNKAEVTPESAVVAENSQLPGIQTAITGIMTKNGLVIGRPRPFPIPSILSPKNSLVPRTEETHPLLAKDAHIEEAGPEIMELLRLQQSDWERLKSNCPVFPLNEDHIDLVFQSGQGRVRREPGLRSDGRVGEQMYCGNCERWEFSHQPGLVKGREAERVEEKINRVEMAKKVLWALLGFLVLVFLVASAVVMWALLG